VEKRLEKARVSFKSGKVS